MANLFSSILTDIDSGLTMAYEVLSILHRHRGILFAFAGGISWGVNALGIALTVQTVSPWVLCYFFFLCHIIAFPYLNWGLDQIYTPKLSLMIFLSSFFDVVLTLTSFSSFDLINFGNASALLYSKTIFCGVLSWIFLRERFTKVDVVLLGIHFVGVTLVTKPSFLFKHFNQGDQISNILGCFLALSGSLASSLEFITVRYLVERGAFDPALLFVNKCVLGMCLAGFLSYFNTSSHRYIRTLLELGYLVFTCVSGFVAYSFNILALRTENAKTVAAILSLEVVVAFLLQVSFTDQTTDILSVSGATLIIVVLVLYCIEGIYYQNRTDDSE